MSVKYKPTTILKYLLLLLIVAGAIYVWANLPDLKGIKKELSFNAYDKKRLPVRRKLVPGTKQFILSKNLPRYVCGAILVSEDASFYIHHGIDWHEIKIALKKDIKEKRYAHGASTITQQLVKNAFLSQRKTVKRKLIEIITSIRVERILSKREILDYYINHIELGPGIYGIHDGAHYYFNEDPKNLIPYQAALIAFFIPNPVKYGRDYLAGRPSEYREKRVKKILRDMVCHKYITPDVYLQYFPSSDISSINKCL